MHFLLLVLYNLTLLYKIRTRSVFQLSQFSMEDNHLCFQTTKCFPVFQLHVLPLLAFKFNVSNLLSQTGTFTIQPISDANKNESQPEYSILELSK